MITSWMSYTLAVSSLVTVAAAVLERVALAKRWPMRFVWGAALALSVMWPILYAAARLAPASAPPSTVLPFTVTVPAIVVTRAGVDAAWLSTIDRVLLSLWLVASVARLARLGRAMVMLRRSQRTWTHDEIDGTTVRISPNVGPAVIGLRQMDVVLPEWIRALDTPLRAIVLRHEEEHRIARDPYLLFGAAIAVALMPCAPLRFFELGEGFRIDGTEGLDLRPYLFIGAVGFVQGFAFEIDQLSGTAC